MKTEEQARIDAQDRANSLGEPVVVFQDRYHFPVMDYGNCSKRVWDKARPNRNLVLVSIIHPEGAQWKKS